jgi:hypothetical protein
VRRNKLFPQKNTPPEMAQKERKKDLEKYILTHMLYSYRSQLDMEEEENSRVIIRGK